MTRYTKVLLAVLALFASTRVNAQEAVSWSGAYVAGFGEYAAGTSTQNDNAFVYHTPHTGSGNPVPPVCPPGEEPIPNPEGGGTICVPPDTTDRGIGDGRYGVTGGFGGGAIGYNYQFAQAVVGLEASIGGGRASGSSPYCGSPAHQCGTSVDAISDVRGRLGYSIGRFLPFVAGGLAVDHVNAYDSLFGGHGAGWLPGFTVGAGLEYKLTPRLSVRAEYIHTEISSHYLYDIVANVPERVGYRSEAARLGIAYSFNAAPIAAPVVAKY